MASFLVAFCSALAILSAPLIIAAASSPLETYIVHAPARMKPSFFASHKNWHASLVSAAIESSTADDRMLYSYETTLQGFAARLTSKEAAALLKMEGVGAIYTDRVSQVHTTRTPAFLGLSPTRASLWRAAKGDVIVGVLDTGVWPERQSYSDAGFAPIPARWNGTCESAPSFNASSLCNRKLIGARFFLKGYEAASGPVNETLEFKSPRDSEGHGTHTSSTVAGNCVPFANLSGLASGSASGISPSSRLAVYKICWLAGCFDSDILAGFDAAISDGVDVISLSVGGDPIAYNEDSIAIGSFAAMSKGIITSCSAGNSGPASRSVSNVAPWIFTIAASSIDRDFPAPAVLGNGMKYKGVSLFVSNGGYDSKDLPLVYAGNAVANGADVTLASLCESSDLLDSDVVQGKVVLCDRGGGIARVAKGLAVKEAGGVAMILGNDEGSGEELIADSHLLPATLVGHQEALAIKQYINSTSNPMAHIDFQGTVLHVKPAPAMTSFSSRGPNSVTPEILKPDITAPGLDILAAWTGFVGPSDLPVDERRVEFNIISGTSMSCPHVAGVTALLKAAQPTWSPAAIRSALMTSATTLDNTGKTITDSSTGAAADPTVFGAGHIHPNAALNPGLIYDLTAQDYLDFLCSLGYTQSMLSVFAESSYDCSKSSISKPGDLNYPSFSAVYYQNESSSFTATFTRTLTNVGHPNCTYTVSIMEPQYVNVSVEPSTLSFQYYNQKLSYSITLSAGMMSFIPEIPQEALSFGSLAWSDGFHIVKSPISFMWQG